MESYIKAPHDSVLVVLLRIILIIIFSEGTINRGVVHCDDERRKAATYQRDIDIEELKCTIVPCMHNNDMIAYMYMYSHFYMYMYIIHIHVLIN